MKRKSLKDAAHKCVYAYLTKALWPGVAPPECIKGGRGLKAAKKSAAPYHKDGIAGGDDTFLTNSAKTNIPQSAGVVKSKMPENLTPEEREVFAEYAGKLLSDGVDPEAADFQAAAAIKAVSR
jgi:hypothetical protein